MRVEDAPSRRWHYSQTPRSVRDLLHAVERRVRNHLEDILLPAPKHQVGLLLLLFLLLLLSSLLRLGLRQVRTIVTRESGPGGEMRAGSRGWPR